MNPFHHPVKSLPLIFASSTSAVREILPLPKTLSITQLASWLVNEHQEVHWFGAVFWYSVVVLTFYQILVRFTHRTKFSRRIE